MHDSNHKPQINLKASALLATLCLLIAHPAPAQRIERDGAVLDGVPAAALTGTIALDRYQQTHQARLLDWLSDGALLVGAEDSQGLKPERVREALAAGESVAAPAVRVRACRAQPNASGWIACLEPDESGSGNTLVLHELGSGASRAVAGSAEQPLGPSWAHDGVRLAFVRAVSGGGEELALLDTPEASAQSRLALPGTGWNLLGWSADDHLLLLRRSLANGAAELALVNLNDNIVLPIELADAKASKSRGARPSRASETPAPAIISAARFSADGRGLFYVSNQDGAAGHLRYQEFSGAQARDLTPTLSPAVQEFDLSADGRYLAYVYREEGISRVALIDQRQGTTSLLNGVPAGSISTPRFNRGADALAFTAESGDAPAEVYVYSLATQQAVRWSSSGSTNLASAMRIRFPTWEHSGREGGATLFRPSGEGRHPVVLLLRAEGPGTEASYDGFVQYLVNERHMAVLTLELAPVHGAPGSDEAEEQQENQLRDLGALLVWVGLRPDLNRDRMAVIGQGAAAPFALLALGQYAERFRAAVCVDGVFGLTSPLPETEGAVLLLNGLSDPLPVGASGEPLLWRLRGAHNLVWYVGLGGPSAAGRELAWRLESAFLSTYLAE